MTDAELDQLVADLRKFAGALAIYAPIDSPDWKTVSTAADALAALRGERDRMREALADTVNHLDGFVALELRRKVGSNWVSEARTFPTSGQCAAGRECAQRARQALGDTE